MLSPFANPSARPYNACDWCNSSWLLRLCTSLVLRTPIWERMQKSRTGMYISSHTQRRQQYLVRKIQFLKLKQGSDVLQAACCGCVKACRIVHLPEDVAWIMAVKLTSLSIDISVEAWVLFAGPCWVWMVLCSQAARFDCKEAWSRGHKPLRLCRNRGWKYKNDCRDVDLNLIASSFERNSPTDLALTEVFLLSRMEVIRRLTLPGRQKELFPDQKDLWRWCESGHGYLQGHQKDLFQNQTYFSKRCELNPG